MCTANNIKIACLSLPKELERKIQEGQFNDPEVKQY
jgi:hypothetical protein